jgi:hypothetical protein
MAQAAEAWKQSLQAWMADQVREPMQIKVSDPLVEGNFMKKFTTYLVSSEKTGANVRRRYSDFEWLSQNLSSRYIGLLLPSMPQKKVSSTKDDKNSKFIRSRMRGLNIFMEQLELLPFVRGDPALEAFISVSDKSGWESAKKGMADQPVCPGLQKWKESAGNVTLPDNAERIIVDMGQQLKPLESYLLSAATAAGKLHEKSASYARELNSLKSGIAEWKAHEEKSSTKSASVDFVNTNYAEMGQVMTQTETMLESWHDILKFDPAITELLMYEGLKYEYQQILQMKHMIRERDSLRDAHLASVRAKEKHELAQQAAAAKGKADKVASLEKAIQEAKLNVDRCLENYELMTKGIFFTELDRYSLDKNLHFRDMFGQIACSSFETSKRLGMMWQGYMGELGVDPTDMITKARVVYDQAAKTNEAALEEADE